LGAASRYARADQQQHAVQLADLVEFVGFVLGQGPRRVLVQQLTQAGDCLFRKLKAKIASGDGPRAKKVAISS
jgi:hypothetical protein